MPDDTQKEYLDRLFRACRFVYNLALETKKRAWESARINLTGFDLINQLTELKNTDCKWLKEFYSQTLQSEMINLSNAYKKFFNGGGYPKFKSRYDRQSAQFVNGIKIIGGFVKIPKLGVVSIIQHRAIGEGSFRTCTVSRESTGKYFISILIKDDNVIPVKADLSQETTTGIDLGLKAFATLSDGCVIDNPKYLDKELKRLRIEQRKLSRRFKRGQKEQSKSWQKQKLIVALLHEKITNKRKDFLHKLSHRLILDFDTICIEDLNIKGMIKNDNLSKAISDVSWSQFITYLTYKSDWYGKNLIKIGRFDPSSKMCSICEAINKELTLTQREWTCPNCGSFHDRDINAAINIKNLGLKAKPTTAKTDPKAESIGCELDAA